MNKVKLSDEEKKKMLKPLEFSWQEGVDTADWKMYPDEILEMVHAQLKKFGLAIQPYNTNSDFHAWKVVKIENNE